MLQPLHLYDTILNLDIINFTEKLIDEWVAALKIEATTLELDRENFIRLVELSLEGSVKIGWDNTLEDTKANVLAGDSKSAIAEQLGRLIKIHFIGDWYFEGSKAEKARKYAQALFGLELRSICAVDEYIYWFRKYFFQSRVATEVAAPMVFAKICSPWREMLIQSYKVPDGQLNSVARRMSFLKDKLKDWCYQASIQKNMKRLRGKLMFDIHPIIAYNLADEDFNRALTLHQDFKRKDLMKEGNRPYSITYRIAYALSNTHHSDLFLRKEYIEIPRVFKEFAKVMTPDPIRIPRIGGVNIVIKDHPVLERTLSTRTQFSSRMSFSKDRIIGYRGKEKELIKP
ncbi:UNVERIFIED_CONTAM: movement protein [Sesamum radiatum]|uniref:Movement protein n=1 Tax=Sesamum radiatum TaxID=300843 RepID=A0AAW2T641_SESRA